VQWSVAASNQLWSPCYHLNQEINLLSCLLYLGLLSDFPYWTWRIGTFIEIWLFLYCMSWCCFFFQFKSIKWRTFLTISDNFFKSLCVLTIDLHLHLLYCKCTLHFALKAPPIICMSRREMDDEVLPWSSPKRKTDKYAKNGEEMMDILVDDIDRYEQLMFQDRLHWVLYVMMLFFFPI
jgi:hypothetical protein